MKRLARKTPPPGRQPPAPHPPPATARGLALEVLGLCRQRDGFVQEILDQCLGRTALSPPDRRLATQLAYGVLRRRGTLFALVKPLVRRPAHKVEPWLWDALCLGAYQLALLSHIPAHAALNETVELAVEWGRPGARGFLNGTLRALVPLLTEQQADGPAADALPVEQGRYRRLARPVLPDPAARPVEYLAAGFGLPQWLAQRWLDRYPAEECRRLGFWFAGPGVLTLRCNRLRTDRDSFLATCREAGIRVEPGAGAWAVRVLDHVPVRDLPGYEKGWFCVQDDSAQRVVEALAPEPGSTVLDLCSAPGGKATGLAERMQNRGRVVACDVDEGRLETVRTLAGRLGMGILETCSVRPEKGEAVPTGPFDHALVDVPCSNTGVLGRRPEVRWRLRPGDLKHLVPLQVRLLKTAVGRVRPGGTVVYSTCSIEPEENRQVVQAVLEGTPGLALEAEEEAVPGRPADGGYWARLRCGPTPGGTGP